MMRIALLESLLLALFAAVVIAGSPTYPPAEMGIAWRIERHHVAATSTTAAVTIYGERGKGAKNVTIVNEGPSGVYVSLTTTSVSTSTASTSTIHIEDGSGRALSAFPVTLLGVQCLPGQTATVEIEATY